MGIDNSTLFSQQLILKMGLLLGVELLPDDSLYANLVLSGLCSVTQISHKFDILLPQSSQFWVK